MRCARYKVDTDQEGWYHIIGRVAGTKGDFPLKRSNGLPQRRLIDIIKHYSSVYYAEVAAYSVMGNHYHLVVRFDSKRKVGRKELYQRALLLYPNSKSEIKQWGKTKWRRLSKRLFNMSEYMRNIQSAFSRWYNKTYTRRGRFWADRFKSVILSNQQAVQDCMVYVELNALRAGIVKQPEKYLYCSLYVRESAQDGWMLDLSVTEGWQGAKALENYKGKIYYRGNVKTRDKQATIPEWILRQEEARGFKTRGKYRKRLRYFADGLILGTEETIRQKLTQLREQGQYLRRKNPIRHLGSIHMSLREQRSHAVGF